MTGLNQDFRLDDNSKTSEDIIRQEGQTTIHLEAGATYNQNSSNEKVNRQPSTSALFKVLAVSILCDFILGTFLYLSTQFTVDSLDMKVDGQIESNKIQIETLKKETKKMLEQAREGNIWLIRRDIIYNIDLHTATKTISKRQYQLLKEEVEHYFAMGGNHDVHDRWDEFNVDIFGTRTITIL